MNESPQRAQRGLPQSVDCRLSTVDALPFTPSSLPAAAEVLLRGGVVILPTETVYGLACHPAFPAALARIRAMKRRDAAKPFQLLAADPAAVWADGALRTPAAERLAAHWPGPLTLVLPTARGIPEGYRVPALPLLQELLRRCGGLLRCTSVNLSGETPAQDAAAAAAALPEPADLLLDGGPARLGIASTVAALTPSGTPQILRQGALRL